MSFDKREKNKKPNLSHATDIFAHNTTRKELAEKEGKMRNSG